MTGPVPKRSEARRRRNGPIIETLHVPGNAGTGVTDTRISEVPTNQLHPIAADFVDSFSDTPANYLFDASDWAELRILGLAMSQLLTSNGTKPIAVDLLAAVIDATDDFLTTEGTRRRLAVEVETTAATQPAAYSHWHPAAREWFDALPLSGQAMWYQTTDWAFAVFVAEVIHRFVTSGERMSGKVYASIQKATTLLLTTEGARRKAQLNLNKTSADDIGLTRLMEAYADYL